MKAMKQICLLFFSVLIAGQAPALPNPAAVYCERWGYEYKKVQTPEGEKGIVIIEPGVQFDAWDFFKGKVGREYSFGAFYGYDTGCVRTNIGTYVAEYAVCVSQGEKGKNNTGIPLLDLMEQKRVPLFDRTAEGGRKASNGAYVSANRDEDLLGIYEVMGEDKLIPAAFDWRTNNAHAYIGSVRDQGSCGSCYAFAAAASAEGTYNWANGAYDADCIDFSESFIIWCLGRQPQYTNHFFGCNGADYDYAELTALTTEGVCLESAFPYTQSDPGSCTHWSDPVTVFLSWHRIPCGDIDAIKTAIMTYGVVDAAVYAGSGFQAYSGGIYTDANTNCYETPCYYTPVNHAIALVGWDDNPPEGGGGCWILRNSWGASWGENGYMRIRYNAARVACEACYFKYLGTNIHTLNVASLYGGADPAVGITTNNHGASIACSITNSPVINGTTQFACTGWSGSGSVPAAGGDTNTGPFTLTNDSMIAWHWQTNFYLQIGTNGCGAVDMASGWQALGSNVVVTATPAYYYHFSYWGGDTGDCAVASNTIAVIMNRAREITAHFMLQPPAAPTGVLAGNGTRMDGIEISWLAVTNATGYTVWRSGTNDTNSAALVAGGIASTNHNDSGAVPGVLYYYWVKATNAAGAGAFSSPDSGWRADICAGVCADYDGDGKADPAIYDEAAGTWRIKLSGANYSLLVTTFSGLGGAGLASVSADYDGDRKADPAVYQELTGTWIILPSSLNYTTPLVLSQTLGGVGYNGAPADYDGDKLADPGVYERTRGDWNFLLSSANYYAVEKLGLLGGTGYRAVAADYDGDKKADPAVYGESNGVWAFKLSSANYLEIILTQTLGGAGYLPVPADYDGDGLADPAVMSATGNEWIVMFSSGGYMPVPLTIQFE